MALLAVVLAASCGRTPVPTFNPLPQDTAAAPTFAPQPDVVPPPGSSRLVIDGSITVRTTQDFDCSYAVDDFFVRGRMAPYRGLPVYLSVNVEFYKRPGPYVRRTQVLVRRISTDNRRYESWYAGQATGTVLPAGRGVDLQRSTLAPEPGTDATGSITVGGHVGCVSRPTPGPG